jgi:hypothetical protein
MNIRQTIIITLLAMLCISATAERVASYPRAFIPFWSEPRGGYEKALLNVNHIIRVVPIFDTKDTKVYKNKLENATHLEVHLSDGKVITVEEDFKEFYTRIRKAGN